MSMWEIVGGIFIGVAGMFLYDFLKTNKVQSNLSSFFRFLIGSVAYALMIVLIVNTGALWVLRRDEATIFMFAVVVTMSGTFWYALVESNTRADIRVTERLKKQNEYFEKLSSAPDASTRQRIIAEYEDSPK